MTATQEQTDTSLSKLVVQIVLILLLWFGAGKLQTRFLNRLKQLEIDSTIAYYLGSILQWLLLYVGVTSILTNRGIKLSSLEFLVNGASVAIAFASQNILKDMAAGFMLLILRIVEIKDIVKIDNIEGVIRHIDLMITHIDTFDNRRVLMPNAKVFENIIIILNGNAYRRVDIYFNTPRAVNIDATRKVLQEAITEVSSNITEKLNEQRAKPRRMQSWLLGNRREEEGHMSEFPAPKVALDSFSDYQLGWRVTVCTRNEDYMSTKSDAIEAIVVALRKAGIPNGGDGTNLNVKMITPGSTEGKKQNKSRSPSEIF